MTLLVFIILPKCACCVLSPLNYVCISKQDFRVSWKHCCTSEQRERSVRVNIPHVSSLLQNSSPCPIVFGASRTADFHAKKRQTHNADCDKETSRYSVASATPASQKSHTPNLSSPKRNVHTLPSYKPKLKNEAEQTKHNGRNQTHAHRSPKHKKKCKKQLTRTYVGMCVWVYTIPHQAKQNKEPNKTIATNKSSSLSLRPPAPTTAAVTTTGCRRGSGRGRLRLRRLAAAAAARRGAHHGALCGFQGSGGGRF